MYKVYGLSLAICSYPQRTANSQESKIELSIVIQEWIQKRFPLGSANFQKNQAYFQQNHNSNKKKSN